MAGPGLESKKNRFQQTDKNPTVLDSYGIYNTNIDELMKIIKTYISENFGQYSDTEKLAIDNFRAQYKHNEMPSDLLKLMNAWQEIPESVTKGIMAMVECYL